MPRGPQSCPLGDFPSSLGATSPLYLSLLEQLALLVSVGHFIRTRLLTSPWDSYPITFLPSPLSSQHILSLVGPLRHCYTRPIAKRPFQCLSSSRRKSSPLWTPCIHLHTRRSREKSEARSLVYNTLVLALHRGHLAGSHPTVLARPPHCFSPYQRGDSSDSTYHPALIIRSPTPLAQPIDWRPGYNHGATTDTTLVPSSCYDCSFLSQIAHLLTRFCSLSSLRTVPSECPTPKHSFFITCYAWSHYPVSPYL